MMSPATAVIISDDGNDKGNYVVRESTKNAVLGRLEDDVNDNFSNKGIAVEANGRTLKVHAGDEPHLVSLGNDRFCTAVTLHPLPQGRTGVGNNSLADIVIHGRGVEDFHCWIDNNEGIVTVRPNGDDVAVQVDGKKIIEATRLTQGCMLCLGRSNFFRFNHPQEAKFMKSVLPYTRVSMMPNAFCPIEMSDDTATLTAENQPQDWVDSWYQAISAGSNGDLLNLSTAQNETTATSKQNSSKVVSPGCSALNAPASVVLSRHKSPVNASSSSGHPFYNSVSIYEDKVKKYSTKVSNGDQNNNEHDREEEKKIEREVCDEEAEDENSFRFSSCESLSQKPRIVPPSPAFNRNPSYINKKCSSPSNDYSSFSSSPRSCSAQHSICSKSEQNEHLPSPTVSFESNGSYAESGLRKMDFEIKRKQAHHNRLLEQERARVEQLRLEEVLTACADYEKQAQFDRSCRSHVRIKTNGSLSRDKSLISTMSQTPESPENSLVFTFDNSESPTSNAENSPIYEKPIYHSSPRTRIRTVPSPKVVRKDYSLELVECKLGALNKGSCNSSPIVKRQNNFDSIDNSESGHELNKTSSSSGDSKLLRNCEFSIIEPAPKLTNNSANKANTLMSQSYHESLDSKNNVNCKSDPMSISCIDFNTRKSDQSKSELFSSNEYLLSKSQLSSKSVTENSDGLEKLNDLVCELNSIVKKAVQPKDEANNKYILPLNEVSSRNGDSKFILPLEEIDNVLRKQRFSMKKCELKKMQNEQNRLLDAINNVKSKLLDIQQQKDEIIRELEMEKALLEGELRSENNKLASEERMLNGACENIKECENRIEQCYKEQTGRKEQNKKILSEQQNILNSLQSSLSCIQNEADKISIIESIRKSREILEEETKGFEDFEFRLLEQEASLLSKKDELQGKLSSISNEIEHTRFKISALYTQKEHLLQNASDEIKSLELQVRCHTRTLQLNHSRLKEISLQLKESSKSFNNIFEEGADSSDECFFPCKTQSQEDLDRISRVTSDAPIMESGSTNSLGRRTIASLQQIERNRQLHLAQQGSQVIEEEKKRMMALKQRVQDEVKARWEETKKQRDCSITSVISDNSSFVSTDRVTDSPHDDEKLIMNIQTEKNHNGNELLFKATAVKKEEENNERIIKVKSSSTSTFADSSKLKLKMNKSNGSYQRPESRYSVYRRQSLDLRQHIESAGHLLNQCPHVFVDKTSCRGYLQKLTTKFRSWNKRWFVFDRQKCSFAYYNDKSEKKLKGGAYFQGLLKLCIDNSNSIKTPNTQATFIVKSTERVFYLLAPGVEAMRIWFDVLATEIETNQD